MQPVCVCVSACVRACAQWRLLHADVLASVLRHRSRRTATCAGAVVLPFCLTNMEPFEPWSQRCRRRPVLGRKEERALLCCDCSPTSCAACVTVYLPAVDLRCSFTGTLLGGGGALGSGGAIQQFVPDPKQRQDLFESVAYDCQFNQQPDGARELFMAAQKPRAALKIINQQLSAAIHANRGAVTDAVGVLLSRGQAAAEAIAAAPDPTSRRDAEAFQQLQLIRQMVELAGQGQWEKVLQASNKLSFVPSERARIEVCKLEVRQLDDSVRERMSDVLEILAAAISKQRASTDSRVLSTLRERVACLKVFVLDLDPSITPQVYERINTCVREFS
eukprot:GHRQ01029610.1.p1 GENE.GHRQ01029610.1~~GHRQ01029610.1.p1  ORF type:complete len:333 (+),score=103.79 GHRQ01029610.1:198-1196(+)